MTMPGFIPDEPVAAPSPSLVPAGFIPDQPSAQSTPTMSTAEAVGRGATQMATLGYGDELYGALKTLEGMPKSLAAKLLTSLTGKQTGTPEERMAIMDQYRTFRDQERARNELAHKEHPVAYPVGEGIGAVATAVVPGIGAAPTVTKGAMTLGRLMQTARTGAAIGGAVGAAAGLGGSNADLTQGDVGGAGLDIAKGAAIGGTFGAAATPIATAVGSALGAASSKLADLGRARLFKAAVGQNKRAFVQMDGKGLLDKAGEYLDKLGIGWGDSTESIAKKLADRNENLGQALTDTVAQLDSSAGNTVKIDPNAVADAIEQKVAGPLKKLASARGEYADIMAEAKAVRDVGEPLSFADAVSQRQAAQSQAKYNAANSRDIAAQAKRDIANIWNEQIDKQAEPLLKEAGKAGNAYRELRHEYSLTTELLKNVNNRVQGNAANRVLSPSDYGVGGISGVMTGNPFVGVAGAIANHLGRIYGNAAAGRTALNMSRAAAVSQAAANKFLPVSMLAARAPAAIGSPSPVMTPVTVDSASIEENPQDQSRIVK